MKYICQSCDKLVDEPFARDGDGYYCSLDCYHENYSEDEIEEDVETLEVPKATHELTGAIDSKKPFWRR